jgi:hypothetical protein
MHYSSGRPTSPVYDRRPMPTARTGRHRAPRTRRWESSHLIGGRASNGLIEHYNETAANYALQDVLAGPRETTMWQQQSDFSEW